MFDNDTIMAAASGLVGWRPEGNNNYPSLSTNMKSPTTSYYVNQLPGISLDLVEHAIGSRVSSVPTYVDEVAKYESLHVFTQFAHAMRAKAGIKELLAHNTLIQHRVNNDAEKKISKDSRFVGYVFNLKASKTVSAQIESIGFYSDTAGTITVYLYETSQKSAIA
jgi:hypothetical protein